MGEFEAIRPFNDTEVPAVLARLINDEQFIDILTRYRFPKLSSPFGWLLKPMLRHRLRQEVSGITSVSMLQDLSLIHI